MTPIKKLTFLAVACFVSGTGYSLYSGYHFTAINGRNEPQSTTSVEEQGTGSRLNLASFWEERGVIHDLGHWSAVALAAAASGKWDGKAEEAAIRALIEDPRLVNELWERMEPSSRAATMDRLMVRMGDECPAMLIPVLVKSTFDLTSLRNLQGAMVGAANVAPEDTFLMLKKCSARIAPGTLTWVMAACASYPEGARKILDDLAAGTTYADHVIKNASGRVLNADGELPPAAAKLEVVQKLVRDRNDQREFRGVLRDGKSFDSKTLTGMSDDSIRDALRGSFYDEGAIKISASQLEELATTGHAKVQSSVLVMMVNSGRVDEATRLLEEAKDLPGTKGNLDQLYETLASSIFESDGDMERVVTFVNRIGDERKYWKAVTGVFSEWAAVDPAGVKQYLPQITDDQLRSQLEKIINRVSVNP